MPAWWRVAARPGSRVGAGRGSLMRMATSAARTLGLGMRMDPGEQGHAISGGATHLQQRICWCWWWSARAELRCGRAEDGAHGWRYPIKDVLGEIVDLHLPDRTMAPLLVSFFLLWASFGTHAGWRHPEVEWHGFFRVDYNKSRR
jgi:hypothetical protein